MNKWKHRKGPEFPGWKTKPTRFSGSAFFSDSCRVSFTVYNTAEPH